MAILKRIGLLEAFLLFVVALFLVDMIIAYGGFVSVGERASEEVLAQAAEAVNAGVLALESDAEAVLVKAADTDSSQGLDFSDTQAANEFLMWYLRMHDSVTSVNYGDSQGNGFLLLKEADRWRNRIKRADEPGVVSWLELDGRGEIVSREVVPDDYDPRLRPWYESAVGLPGVRWSDPYVLRTTRDPGITASLRLPSRGDGVERVVGVDIMLRDISRLLASLRREKSDLQVYLTSEEGLVIAASDEQGFLPHLAADTPGLPTLDDETFEAPRNALFAASDTESRLLSFEAAGVDYYGLTRPVGLPEDLRLNMVLIVPRDSLLSYFEFASRIRALAFFFFAALASIVFVRLYLIPIRGLTGAVRSLSSGLSLPPLTTGRRDEVGVLISEFGRMAGDLSERQAQLQRAADEWHLTFDSMPDLVSVHDTEHVVLKANRSMAHFFGLEPEDLVGKKCHELYMRSEGPCPTCPFPAMVASMESVTAEVHSPHLGAWFQTTSSPIVDSTGGLVGCVHIARDLTALRGLEDRLRQSQKMEAVGRLAGGVAHDFNNMLGVIIGYAGEARAGLHADDPVRADLDEVLAAAERSASLTRELLAFSRRQPVEPHVIDVNDRLRGMKGLLGRIVGEDIEVRLDPAEDVWPVYIDASQFDQAVANLVANSRDAMPGGGVLELRSENVSLGADDAPRVTNGDFFPGDYVVLEVADSGHGMNAETLAHVFEPFFTTKSSEGGTGLGMATVYGMVGQNQGFIDVDSAPGAGTTVRVYFPRYTGGDLPSVDESEAASIIPGGPETVLLVEDEEQVRRLVRTLLERSGYTVFEAAESATALELSQGSGEIHLLLTDVVMPGMNGRELDVVVREHRPDIKVLYMSGYTADVIASRGVIDEGVHFLQKPFSPVALLRRVREVLDGE